MTRLNRKLEYALLALKALSEGTKSELVTAKSLSQQYQLSFDLLSRVLQSLVKLKIVSSSQGTQGGYRLCKKLSEINMLQLIEGVVGDVEVVSCISDPQSCELSESCLIQGPILEFNERLREFFQSLSIEEILGSKSLSTSGLGKELKYKNSKIEVSAS